jgi:hypothetical protein
MQTASPAVPLQRSMTERDVPNLPYLAQAARGRNYPPRATEQTGAASMHRSGAIVALR